MALDRIKFNIASFNDTDADGNNYYAGIIYEVFNSNDTLADIYSDAAGANPINQDGISNKSNSSGEAVFYIDSGSYYIKVDGKIDPFKSSDLSSDGLSIFSSVENMALNIDVSGRSVELFNGKGLAVVGEDNSFTSYVVVLTSSDVDLGDGFWARKMRTLSRWDQVGYNGLVVREDAPNVIAGHSKNAISPDVHSSTISGGGLENKENVIGGIAANVNTEMSNVPVGGPTTGQESKFALIGGGYDNVCNGLANVITVGQHCVIDLPADHGSIHGGSHNKILEGSYNTIGGGTRNTVYSDGFSVIAGGGDGWVGTGCTHAVVSGGSLNEVYASFSSISGGQQNLVAATSPTSSIGGGSGNETRQGNSTIAGGNGNLVDSTGQGSSVGGGINNTANGQCATVIGGRENEAVKNYSQASGYQSKAERPGQESFSNGQFFVRGDAQTSRIILKGLTSGIQTTTLEDLSGGIDFPNKTKIGIGYNIRIVAHDTGSDNENAVIILEGMASKGASGNWVINSFADKIVSTTSLALVAAEIFNSAGSLRVKVTGVAGASLNWVANIEYTENVG